MTTKQIIEDFENEFGLSSLYAKPTEYMEHEEVYGKVKMFLESALAAQKKEIEAEQKSWLSPHEFDSMKGEHVREFLNKFWTPSSLN